MTDVGTKDIQIVVNGQVRSNVPEGRTLAQLLEWLEIAPERVAVELNRQIVRRPEWELTTVAPGATLEIVQFVGGGWLRLFFLLNAFNRSGRIYMPSTSKR
jgi:sulfur carrier protein